MRPTWLLEANVTGLPSEALQAEVRRQGMEVRVAKFIPDYTLPADIAGSESLGMDACVIFMGTLPVMRHIQRTRRWNPGGWCTFENLSCSTYHSYLGQWLLNQEYSILPITEAIRLADSLIERHGAGGEVFVRPDSASKLFKGAVLELDALQSTLSRAAVDPRTLVLVAKPLSIGREWRLIVAHGKVITGSQYCVDGRPQIVAGCPDEIVRFANRILEQVSWRPDPLFVMDVGECAEGLRVIELNGFSCSSLYAAELSVLVETASRFASALAH
jgi:hypothetical protein